MSDTLAHTDLKSLRDFFGAVDEKDLKAAAGLIAHHFALPLSELINWTEVEYDFNRLFVGPASVPAPPYASAYHEDPSLMSNETLAARNTYQLLGLSVPDVGSTPDDHLAFELDAALALRIFAADDQHRDNTDLSDLHTWFIGEHMGQWVPKFIEAVHAQEGVSQPVSMAVSALQQWLNSEMDMLASTTKEQPSTY